MRAYSIGKHTFGNVEEIKYDGRLIILDDGSRWEVNEIDSPTCEFCNCFDKVVVIDDAMFNLGGCESVQVEEE